MATAAGAGMVARVSLWTTLINVAKFTTIAMASWMTPAVRSSVDIIWYHTNPNAKKGDVDLPTPNGNTTRLTPVCAKSGSECGVGACECDVAFANCLREFKVGEKKVCPKK